MLQNNKIQIGKIAAKTPSINLKQSQKRMLANN